MITEDIAFKVFNRITINGCREMCFDRFFQAIKELQTMTKFDYLQAQIIDWAKDKQILAHENYPNQMMKVFEELGELSGAILKGKRGLELDSFGDILVTLIILAKQREVDLTECLELAWNEIKDRKGKTENGTFIKSE